jgi:uncharacterized membrane protein
MTGNQQHPAEKGAGVVARKANLYFALFLCATIALSVTINYLFGSHTTEEAGVLGMILYLLATDMGDREEQTKTDVILRQEIRLLKERIGKLEERATS